MSPLFADVIIKALGWGMTAFVRHDLMFIWNSHKVAFLGEPLWREIGGRGVPTRRRQVRVGKHPDFIDGA